MFFDDLAQDLVAARGSSVDIVVNGLEDQRLHGDPLTLGGGTQFGGLLIGQSQGHGHGADDTGAIPLPGGDLNALPMGRRLLSPHPHHPPGDHLKAGLDGLVGWMRQDHRARVDPVVATAMSHYQLETLHPFIDGNGRLGRLLVVLHLQGIGVLTEPTLTVSSWFEARRTDYYDHLLAVSTRGDWDPFIGFFAAGLRASAESTRTQMRALVRVQAELADIVGGSNLRSANARALVDLAVANPSFTVRQVEARLGISYGRANALIGQLMELGILDVVDEKAYKRIFFAPRIIDVLTGESGK